MRSTILLASFLAVLPFISATPANPPPPSPSPQIVKNVTLPNGKVYNYVDCRQFPSLQHERPILPYLGDITIERCMETCNADGKYLMKGGVGDNRCFCDSVNRGVTVNDGDCMQPKYTCLGNPLEFCGSDKALVLYTHA